MRKGNELKNKLNLMHTQYVADVTRIIIMLFRFIN